MSARAISEASGKRLLQAELVGCSLGQARFASVTDETDWDKLVAENPWLKTEVCRSV
jgi:hypothetical protein